jgi:hypothetical protein
LKRIPNRIILNGSPVEARKLLRRASERGFSHEFGIRELISRLNRGRDFGQDTADEWKRCLGLLLSGRAKALMNPYAEIADFTVEPISRKAKHLDDTPLIRQLAPFSDSDPRDGGAGSQGLTDRMLLVLAVGGSDTTFYSGMSGEEIAEFVRDFIPAGFLECLDPSDIRRGIPRAFASKTSADGRTFTLVESLMAQAYAGGIRHVAVLSNPSLAPAITAYLTKCFSGSPGFKWCVTVQPLLPVIVEGPDGGCWSISEQHPGYPGGHGHGFKHTLTDAAVREWIRDDGLEYFLFSNGDNAALFNHGAGQFEETIEAMRSLKVQGAAPGLRTAFFLVWERFRKGGFAFFLRGDEEGKTLPQIIEAELALESGVDMSALNLSSGAYNTNVAVGFLAEAYAHLDRLPLTLKHKKLRGCEHWMFEASFATAMSTFQDETGRSHFDAGSSMAVLAPNEAVHPHWIHLSLRNRSEWLVYRSSLFRPETLRPEGGEFLSARCDRDASIPLPNLEGDVLNTGTKEFFDIFKDAAFDMDSFSGALRIDFPEGEGGRRGRIRFEGAIRFTGEGCVTFRIPPGESWTVRGTTIHSPAEFTRAAQIPV